MRVAFRSYRDVPVLHARHARGDGGRARLAGSGKSAPASVVLLLAMVFAMLSGTAHATVNLATNGGFEQLLVANKSSEFGSQQTSQQVIGWTATGYNFVFTPSQPADTVGATQGSSTLKLWGTNDGGLNTLILSPDGGNYIAADGVYQVGTISQTINGLTPGDRVVVSFWYGGSQQYSYTGATTEGWQVTLGAQTISTPMVSNASHGFTGWYQATLSFVATSTSETLSFLPLGTPSGVPPFSLLDGVVVTTPEPATWTILLGGTGVLFGIARRRRRSTVRAGDDKG